MNFTVVVIKFALDRRGKLRGLDHDVGTLPLT
jgi:hypothetical protein